MPIPRINLTWLYIVNAFDRNDPPGASAALRRDCAPFFDRTMETIMYICLLESAEKGEYTPGGTELASRVRAWLAMNEDALKIDKSMFITENSHVKIEKLNL